MYSYRSFIAILVISVFFGSISLWKLHEDDIYWIIRAGDDILKSMSIPNTETWSFSIPGRPWVNYHWLSQVLIRIIYGIGKEPALVTFRALCIGLFIYLVQMIIFCRKQVVDTKVNFISILTLVPIIYISMIFRLHLRPDFFCLIAFAFFIHRESERQEWYRRQFPIWWFICLFISSQWHAGVAVYLGFLIATLIFFNIFESISDFKNIKNWLYLFKYAGLVSIAYFFNPSHFKMLKLLWVHANYDQRYISNTEYLSFDFGLLDVTSQGWPFILWSLYLVLGWVSFLYIKITKKRISSMYGNYIAVFIIGLVFTLLSLKYIRMIPFHLIFFLPMVSYVLNNFQKNYSDSKYYVLAVMIFIWALPLQSEIRRFQHLWGLEVNEQHFPVREVEFVKRIKPKGQIFSDLLSGSYQSWALREYPIFIDHRDVLYNDIKPLFLGFMSSPQITRYVEEKYDIHTAFMPIIPNRWDSNGKLVAGLNYLMPPELWTLVFFTNRIAVFIKKIPEHKNIIKKYQYQYLNPSYPLHIALLKSESNSQIKQRLEEEVSRCLIDTPRNTYCISVKSEFLLKKANVVEAIQLLEHSRYLDPRKNTNILIQLWKAYTKAGQEKKAKAIDQILNKRFNE